MLSNIEDRLKNKLVDNDLTKSWIFTRALTSHSPKTNFHTLHSFLEHISPTINNSDVTHSLSEFLKSLVNHHGKNKNSLVSLNDFNSVSSRAQSKFSTSGIIDGNLINISDSNRELMNYLNGASHRVSHRIRDVYTGIPTQILVDKCICLNKELKVYTLPLPETFAKLPKKYQTELNRIKSDYGCTCDRCGKLLPLRNRFYGIYPKTLCSQCELEIKQERFFETTQANALPKLFSRNNLHNALL